MLFFTIGCEPVNNGHNTPTTEVPTCVDDANFSVGVKNAQGATVLIHYLAWEDWGEGHPLRNVVRWSKEPFDLIKDAREQKVFFQLKINGCWKNVDEEPYSNFNEGWRRATEQLNKL